MKPYSFDVNINGKITIEVMAENKKQASQMLNELLENSTFMEVMDKSTMPVLLQLREHKSKEMER